MNIDERCRIYNRIWWAIYGDKDMSHAGPQGKFAKQQGREKTKVKAKWCEKHGYVAEDFDCEGCRKCEG